MDLCEIKLSIGNCKLPLTVADPRGGVPGTRPPNGPNFSKISCSFWENLAILYVGAPPPPL